jgi:hypothetical protein
MAVCSAMWLDRELGGCHLADGRLTRRGQIGGAVGQSIPFACQDWANAKATYRFLSNERVNEADILAGHFQSTRERAAATEGLIFVLHDTTEFTFQREASQAIGFTKSVNSGRDKVGRARSHTVCGVLMHSSLALTAGGVPVGLAAVKVRTRQKFKGTAALKRKFNPTRVPIETKESVRWLENLAQSTELLGDPGRCVHIGDREGDIYELFCLAHELGTRFLLRTCVKRRAGDGDHTVADEMDEAAAKKRHRIEVRDGSGDHDHALLEIGSREIRILPPIGKWKRCPALELTVIHAEDGASPRNCKRICWKLITNLSVDSGR